MGDLPDSRSQPEGRVVLGRQMPGRGGEMVVGIEADVYQETWPQDYSRLPHFEGVRSDEFPFFYDYGEESGI